MSNAKQFKLDLNRAYENKVLKRLENTVKEVSVGIADYLYEDTPVKTGRARTNWLPSLNSPQRVTSITYRKPSIANTLAAYKLSDTVYISNNLTYIQRLNNGSSIQAPANFVTMAAQRVLVEKGLL